MLTILGHDTGVTNAAYAVVSFRPNPKGKKYPWQFKVHAVGILQNTLSDLKDGHTEQMQAYSDEVIALVKKYKAESIIAERFMIRSFRTATAEYISWMLGFLDKDLAIRTKIRMTPIPAVTWKNAVNKVFDLKEFYKKVHAFPHEIDSVLMCFYKADCLSLLQTKKAQQELQWKLEKKTTRPPKRVRKGQQSTCTTKKKMPVKRKPRRG